MRSAAWVVFMLSALAMASIAFAYVPPPDPSTLFNPIYASHRWLLTTHALFAGLALMLTPFQLLPRLQRIPSLHRRLGWAYVSFAMIGAAAGIAMAPLSLGGPVATLGFATFGTVWIASTWLGVSAIRQGELAQHRRWMWASAGMAYTAVTFRLGDAGLLAFGVPTSLRHDVMTWACWIPNLAFTEWLSRRRTTQAESVRTATPAL